MTVTLPSASTRIDDEAGAIASGVDLLCVIAPVATAADVTPRQFASAAALLDQHGYAPGVDYVAMHVEETGKPVLFVGIPIATPGVISREDKSGNTGTSTTTLAAGSDGPLDETDGVLTVVTGGTVGTDQIVLGVSLDGGRTTKNVRLGTASSYTIPYVGLTVSFGAGTLIAGQTLHTWHTSAPLGDNAGITAARTAMASQLKTARSWLTISELQIADDASNLVTQVNAYETANERFTVARAQIKDRLPDASLSNDRVVMTGSPTLTFTEVGATGDQITRSTGSWLADGFVAGDTITVSGSASNNVTGTINSLSATVISLDATDLADEAAVPDCTVTAVPTITFAEVGATGDTITRNRGSWLTDGFRVGDKPVVTGSASNNITAASGITAVTALVMTLDDDDLTAEEIGSTSLTITAGTTKAQHVSEMDALFSGIASERRVDLALGRARKLSPITGWRFRRGASWAASIREYQHDVHIPVWRKSDGPLSGWDLNDTSGNLVEHDERIDSGALAAGFTCMRSWSNGPNGAFMAQSLTRAATNSLLSRTHNMAVANVACRINQTETENGVGQNFQLNDDGTGMDASLSKLEGRVNSALASALLTAGTEGPRASRASWAANRGDVLNEVDATLTGVLTLLVNGTLEHINTTVRIQTAGA